MITQKINDLRSSFYCTRFYNGLSEHSFEKGMGFVVFWSFVASLVGSAIVAMGIVPLVFTFSGEEYVEEYYPSELVITIEDGIATTNVEEPYYVGMDDVDENEGKRFGIYLDTKRDLTISDAQSYDAFGVLTKDTLVMSDGDGETRMVTLADIGNFTLDKDVALHYVEVAMKWARILIVPAVLLVAIFITIASVLSYLFLDLFGALIVMMVGKLYKRTFSYKTAYTIALFATGPVIIADIALMLFGIMTLPMSVTLVVFLAVILANIRAVPVAQTPVPAPTEEKVG